MGHTKKILSNELIQAIPRFNSNQITLELAENFHLHYRNYRLELDEIEFEQLSKAFIEGYAKWLANGKKNTLDYKYKGDKNLFLSRKKIPVIPSILNENTSIYSARVEIQKYADYVHVHYKDFRFEFSITEFNEFSEVIKSGSQGLKELLENEPSPYRVGYLHRSIPFGRVNSVLENCNYWINEDDDKKILNLYESTYSEEDRNLIPNRELIKPYYLVHIADFFEYSLYHSKEYGEWGWDKKQNLQLTLFNRLEFVRFVVEKNFHISDNEIKETNYYKLLTKDISDFPRDGESKGVYFDPLNQSKKFIELIKSIYQNGYLGEIYKSDGSIMIDKNGNNYKQINFESNSHVTAVVDSCGLRVFNGQHRLAILYYMHSIGKLDSPLIKVYIMESSNFKRSIYKNLRGRIENFFTGIQSYTYKVYLSPLVIYFISISVIRRIYRKIKKYYIL